MPYNPRKPPSPGRPPRRLVAGLAVSLALVIAGAVAFFRADAIPAPALPEMPIEEVAATVSPDVGGLETEGEGSAGIPTEFDPTVWTKIKVRRGDTLSHIFARLGIEAQEASRIVNSHPDSKALARLVPGQALKVRSDTGTVEELVYRINEIESLHVRRTDTGFEASRETRKFDVQLREVSGEIRSSLFADGQRAGLPDNLIMQLAEIFGWDIDFALDLRTGDRFTVLHEEKYWQGSKAGNGPILAAEFVNDGKVYRAVGHRGKNGVVNYYTPEGLSLRRAFLRSPVKFSRITSSFKKKRFHPVLKRWRAHKGVDYGAPTGTPVMATATGRVELARMHGGYGKTIILRHAGSYKTLYAHLSRYQRGIRAGKTVEQGQIIGYVGKTGLATGPHLHYEFQVGGTHRNPLTFKFPYAEPIPAEQKQEFLNQARLLLSQLESARNNILASNP